MLWRHWIFFEPYQFSGGPNLSIVWWLSLVVNWYYKGCLMCRRAVLFTNLSSEFDAFKWLRITMICKWWNSWIDPKLFVGRVNVNNSIQSQNQRNRKEKKKIQPTRQSQQDKLPDCELSRFLAFLFTSTTSIL